MLIEDVCHHYGHHYNDDGPDLETGLCHFQTNAVSSPSSALIGVTIRAADLLCAESEIMLRITTTWISKTLISGSRRTWLRMAGCLCIRHVALLANTFLEIRTLQGGGPGRTIHFSGVSLDH